jgi:hypothetical protein
MTKASGGKAVQNKGGCALGERLKKTGESMAGVERRCGFSDGYVDNLIKGEHRPGYARRSILRSEFGIALGAWDVDIVTKEGAAS